MKPYLDTPEIANFMKDYYGAEIYTGIPGFPVCIYKNNNKTVVVNLLKYCYHYPKSYLCPLTSKEIIVTIKQKLHPDIINIKLFNTGARSRLICPISKFTSEPTLTDFGKKTRNQTKKSLTYGFSTKIINKVENIYPLYQKSMIRLRSKLRELNYFVKLQELLGDKLLIFGVYKGAEIGAVNIAFINNDYLLLMFSFSLEKYWPECVNNFLYFQTMLHAYKEGVRIFDFGPVDIADLTHRHFKNGYGAKEFYIENILWYKNPIRQVEKIIVENFDLTMAKFRDKDLNIDKHVNKL